MMDPYRRKTVEAGTGKQRKTVERDRQRGWQDRARAGRTGAGWVVRSEEVVERSRAVGCCRYGRGAGAPLTGRGVG